MRHMLRGRSCQRRGLGYLYANIGGCIDFRMPQRMHQILFTSLADIVEQMRAAKKRRRVLARISSTWWREWGLQLGCIIIPGHGGCGSYQHHWRQTRESRRVIQGHRLSGNGSGYSCWAVTPFRAKSGRELLAIRKTVGRFAQGLIFATFAWKRSGFGHKVVCGPVLPGKLRVRRPGQRSIGCWCWCGYGCERMCSQHHELSVLESLWKVIGMALVCRLRATQSSARHVFERTKNKKRKRGRAVKNQRNVYGGCLFPKRASW